MRMMPVAFLSAALLAAQPGADIRVDVDLVTVPCSVTDHGVPVKGLKREDFVLRDDGQPRAITNFWQESDLPLTIALVADVSGSQAGFIKNHREAVAQFFRQVMSTRDRAMVVEVAQQAWLLSDLTGSSEESGRGSGKNWNARRKAGGAFGPSLQECGVAPHLRRDGPLACSLLCGPAIENGHRTESDRYPLRRDGHRQRH